jgi:hypothetical protein
VGGLFIVIFFPSHLTVILPIHDSWTMQHCSKKTLPSTNNMQYTVHILDRIETLVLSSRFSLLRLSCPFSLTPLAYVYRPCSYHLCSDLANHCVPTGQAPVCSSRCMSGHDRMAPLLLLHRPYPTALAGFRRLPDSSSLPRNLYLIRVCMLCVCVYVCGNHTIDGDTGEYCVISIRL